jgi:outer membrane receptor protein involved in Fe transport
MCRKATIAAAALLLWAVVAQAAGADVNTVTKGQPLARALEQLRSLGLPLIFSSALIGADLRVEEDPGSGTPEEIARRILAPHGLTLEAIRPNLFAVVKRTDDAGAQKARSSGDAEAAKSSAQAESLYEIDIYASRYKIEQQEATTSLAELAREDIEVLPGLNQDVMRVTRFLPGTAANALSARSHVRGGRDDELAVYFDGVPLFEPFHYKDVQSLFGLLDPSSISTVDFFSGVFPARYGNRLSGVLDIAPRTWDGAGFNALGASVLYSHALTQGRLDSFPLEWLASVRRGNVDMFADLIGRGETEPEFFDALGRLHLDLGPRAALVGGWLLLNDELRVNFEDGSERGDVEYRDATGWLSFRFLPIDQVELRATLSRTERHTDRQGSVDQPRNSVGTLEDRRRFDTTTFRLEANAGLPRNVRLNTGFEMYDYSAQYRYESAATFDPALAAAFGRAPSYSQLTSLSSTGEAYAAYGSAQIGVARGATLDLSLRWDAQRFGAAFHDSQLSPRVSVQYDYDPATTLRLSWGRSAQTLRPDELQVAEGDSSFPAAQRATQVAVSMERQFARAASLRVELYDKRVHDPSPAYENLLDPFALLPELEVDRVRIQPDRSRIYGAEMSVRWQLPERWSGWTSYSWSEATDHFGPVSVLRTWDQKHAVASGLAWTLRPWQLSANMTWHSGWRRNLLVETPTGVELGPRNADNWPPYLSLDVRAGWRHALPRGTLDAFFEIDNLTNHSNSCCSSYRLASNGLSGLSREDSSWLPRVFLLGVTWQLP